jgi:nitrosocyanin
MRPFKFVFSAILFLAVGFATTGAFAEVRTFQEYAVEVGGVKFWLPSTLTVRKGDTVKIKAISKLGGANNIHGFAIDEFKVQELVEGKEKEIEFVASKAGIFPIRCHLHPPHVGGQLIVLE